VDGDAVGLELGEELGEVFGSGVVDGGEAELLWACAFEEVAADAAGVPAHADDAEGFNGL